MWRREVLKDFDLSLHIIMVFIPGSESQYGNSASYQVSILVIYPGTDEITGVVLWTYSAYCDSNLS